MGVGPLSPMHAPALQYLQVRAAVSPAVVLFLTAQGVFRGLKDTRDAPRCHPWSGNVVNILLDPLLIFSCGWACPALPAATVGSTSNEHGGVAAAATECHSAPHPALALPPLLPPLSSRPGVFPLNPAPRPLPRASSLQAGCYWGERWALLGAMAVGTSMAARQGAVPMAAHQLALQLCLAASLLSDSVALAAQTLLASAFARNDTVMVRAIMLRSLQIGLGMGAVMGVVLSLSAQLLPALFTSDDRVLLQAVALMPFAAAMQPLASMAFMALAPAAAAVLVYAPSEWGVEGVWIGPLSPHGCPHVCRLPQVSGMAEAGSATARSPAEEAGVESDMARLAVADATDGKPAGGGADVDELDDVEQTEVVLFHLKECYVYKVRTVTHPPSRFRAFLIRAVAMRSGESRACGTAWRNVITFILLSPVPSPLPALPSPSLALPAGADPPLPRGGTRFPHARQQRRTGARTLPHSPPSPHSHSPHPPRSPHSQADEWDINRWAWEGAISVVSRGDHCSIRLLDAASGDLFAHRRPWRPNHPLPLEAVIDSSRFFVLRIEDSSPPPPSTASAASASSASSSKAGKPAAAAAPVVRHAFIGLGFRERTAAYDFQAAVYDHVKYVHKQQEARRMGQAFESRPAADYRLKEGQKLHLDIKTPARAKPSTAGLPLSPTTPGNVAFKSPSLTGPAPDASAPMRQASGDHAAADSSPPHATAAATTAGASPPILPPPPPARLSSPPSASPSSPPSTSFSVRSFPPAAPSPSIAWAFQSDDPPASVTSAPQSVMPATSGGSEGAGSAAAAGEDTDDFGEFVAA
ncbi:unnamed protein product [Closterium sp. NIES-65]|nr:unnamed protein product [Closterium sp. NIES-65]